MVSTSSRAGWPAASIARRTALISEVTPVEVSLWTTHTALIAWPLSARSRCSIRSARTPCRHASGSPVVVQVPGSAMTSGASCRRSASLAHRLAKWPVSYISTASPGLVTLTSAASHAPVPEAG